MPEFSGFGPTLVFLKDLAANNDRGWFQDHKDRYQSEYLPPILSFIETVGARLKAISPGLQADPRLSGGSLMRIYRDTRFSKDKTPYKTWVGVTFWEGAGKPKEEPGFHFYMDNDGAVIYGGRHGFPQEVLPKFRRAVDDDQLGTQLLTALQAVSDAGEYEIGGEQYARVPHEYDPEHPRGDLLRYKGLFARSAVIPAVELNSPSLIELCLRHFQNMAPLHDWLVAMNALS